jgi:hypothetical protein
MTQGKNTTSKRESLDWLRDIVEDAIAHELETAEAIGNNQRRGSPMFAFCHELKSNDKLAALSAEQAAEYVNRALCELYADAYPGVEDDPWYGPDWPNYYEDPQALFLLAWDKVRLPVGIFDRAVKLAASNPISLRRKSTGFAQFVNLCAWCQRLAGTLPIPVSVTAFGKALQVSPKMISVYSQLAQGAGLLTKTKEAEMNRRAAEYRFDLDKLQSLLRTQ